MSVPAVLLFAPCIDREQMHAEEGPIYLNPGIWYLDGEREEVVGEEG